MLAQNVINVLGETFILAGKFVLCYGCTIPFLALPAVFQEIKVWKSTPYPLTAMGIFKVYLTNLMWMSLGLFASLSLIPMWAGRGFGRTVEVEAHSVMERLISMAIVKTIAGNVEVRGEENIPGPTPPGKPAPVYVANHCSQIDIPSVYFPFSRFKWIAKSSVKFVPGAGNIMYLSGHVFIKRSGNNSQSVNNLFEQSNRAIQSGVPMMIYPQGTRSVSKKLPFKDGAFKIALENKSEIVPISINVPPATWNSFYPFCLLWGGKGETIVITIHEPIQAKEGISREELKKQSMDIIYSVLPPLYHGEDVKKVKDSSASRPGTDENEMKPKQS